MRSPFRYYKTSPDIIRLAVMMYVRFPLSLRQVEDLLHERGIEISYETVRAWWSQFGPLFAADIRKKRAGTAKLTPASQLIPPAVPSHAATARSQDPKALCLSAR